jgi:hypothetical protein
MGKKAKKLGCCEAYKDDKGKTCKDCPYAATLSKEKRKALKEKYR